MMGMILADDQRNDKVLDIFSMREGDDSIKEVLILLMILYIFYEGMILKLREGV